jgi:uncharacterized repeat protein (TIGR02543 family)
MSLYVNGATNFITVNANGTEARTIVSNGTIVYAKAFITFNEQGGSAVSDRYVWYGRTYGQYAALPSPTRSGYTFGGWFTQTLGNGTQITASTVRTSTNLTQTLYAYWISTVVPTSNPSFTGWSYFGSQWYISIRNNDSLAADIKANDFTPPSTIRSGGSTASGATAQSFSSNPSFATFTHYATATASNGTKTVSSVVSQTIT